MIDDITELGKIYSSCMPSWIYYGVWTWAIVFIVYVSSNTLYNSNYSGEDAYQKSRFEEGAKTHIYATMYFDDIDYVMNRFEKNMKELFEDYFKHNPEMLILIPIVVSEENESQREIDNEYDLWKTIDNSKIFFAVYNKKKSRFTLLLDHRYFGGLFFMKLSSKMTNCKPVTVYNESYIPILTEILVLRLLIYWNLRPNPIPFLFVNKESDIQRKTFTFNILDLSSSLSVRKQTQVLYNILEPIFKELHPIIKRPLNILLPVAFESTRKTFNNVGGIFIRFDGQTIEDFEKQLMQNKYHAHASNNLQKYTNLGKKARSNLDIVFSSGCIKSFGEPVIPCNKLSISYLSIAHYPIYIISITQENTVFVTITSMTPMLRF